MSVSRAEKGDKILPEEHPGSANFCPGDGPGCGELTQGLRVDLQEVGSFSDGKGGCISHLSYAYYRDAAYQWSLCCPIK